MLEVNVTEVEKNDVEAGQVRYNDGGMFVLITYGGTVGHYDAVILKGGKTVKNFDWNSKCQHSSVILKNYPHIADAKLEINV